MNSWKLLLWLQGKKTYLVALVAAILTFAWQCEWIDSATYEQWFQWIQIGGLATVYAMIRRMLGGTLKVDTNAQWNSPTTKMP